jgi:hypothetical protein
VRGVFKIGLAAGFTAALSLLMTGGIARAAEVRPASIAGPEGVAQELAKAGKRESIYPITQALQPYFDWKERIKSDHAQLLGHAGPAAPHRSRCQP